MHITYRTQQQTFLLLCLRVCFRRSLRALSSHLMPLWWNGVCRRFPAAPELRAWALLRLKRALCMTCNSFRRRTSQCVLMRWFRQPDHAEWSECHKHTYHHHVVLLLSGGWGVGGVQRRSEWNTASSQWNHLQFGICREHFPLGFMLISAASQA